ncbi:hypothetical protein BJ170DRAFT_736541 [Xylariales sp. AK1849]|nr:hypothetical protein BJ170DRAFT_736541 [Xylariales sp. AK1849]
MVADREFRRNRCSACLGRPTRGVSPSFYPSCMHCVRLLLVDDSSTLPHPWAQPPVDLHDLKPYQKLDSSPHSAATMANHRGFTPNEVHRPASEQPAYPSRVHGGCEAMPTAKLNQDKSYSRKLSWRGWNQESPESTAVSLCLSSLEELGSSKDMKVAAQHVEDAKQREQLLAAWADNGLYPYARKDKLSKYIPELDPVHPRAQTLRVRMSKRSAVLRIQVALAVSVVIANIGITIWIMVHYHPDPRGIGTLSFGNCKEMDTINTVLHVGLNIMSSLFLGAGNYCMQIIGAPSRQEIDTAHANGVSLDIGVPSVKNIWHIQRQRKLFWVLFGICATTLHLFWNSAVFVSIPIVSYPRAIVTSDFWESAEEWKGSIEQYPYFDGILVDESQNVSSVYALRTAAGNFTRLEKKACIEQYIDPTKATSDLIVVALNTTTSRDVSNQSSLVYGWLSGWDSWYTSQNWICSANNAIATTRYRWCSEGWASTFSDEWQIVGEAEPPRGRPEAPSIPIDYCLVGEKGSDDDRCGLHYSTHIILVVCSCTLVEGLLIIHTWIKHPKETMVTMGDAIACFLKDPDLHADGAADAGAGELAKPRPVKVEQAHWTIEPRLFWFHAVSGRVWRLSLSLYPFNLGIGHKTAQLLVHILWANSFQLMISFLYMFYNAILTRQLVADEWIRSLRREGKKPLRVSSPVGIQRSSYMLSLPMTYSIPLMMAMIMLHWLTSQSIFLVRTCSFGPGLTNLRLPTYDTSAVQSSPVGTILSVSHGAALVLLLVINSFAKYYKDVPRGFPVMGYSSAAISAACQRPDDDVDAYLFPVSLGVIADSKSDSVPGVSGRLAFSTLIDLEPPEPGKQYLQPVAVHRGQGPRRRYTENLIITLELWYRSFRILINRGWGHIRKKGRTKCEV